jgi:hypothetical protein
MTVTAIAVLVNVMLTEDGDYNNSVNKCSVKTEHLLTLLL